MKLYSKKLTTFEQAEILDFPEVWFLGLNAKKIEGVPGAPMNNGKLSSRGGSRTAATSNMEHSVIIVNKEFHLGCCSSPRSASGFDLTL